jgi:hypothetical protein
MEYIQFERGFPEKLGTQTNWSIRLLQKLLKIILESIIPRANPDYDDQIKKIKYWLLEIESDTGSPIREVGLDQSLKPILKMPFRDNYGYWTDNNLFLSDFIE